jgi:hypothetical protein
VANPLPKPVTPQGTYDESLSAVARQLPTEAESDPDLARIIIAWPNLPDHIRAAVLALVGTVG